MIFYKIASSLGQDSERFLESVAKACFVSGKDKDPLFALKRVKNAKLNIEKRIATGSSGFEIQEIFGTTTDFLYKLEAANKYDAADRSAAEDEFLVTDDITFLEKLKDAIIILSKVEPSLSGLVTVADKKLSDITNIPEKIVEKEPDIKSLPAEQTSRPTLNQSAANMFYVSKENDSKNIFLKGTDFYGPFEDRSPAVIFSFLIHEPRSFEERTISIGGKLLESRNLDLSLAKDVGTADIKNVFFLGLIENLSLELTSGKSRIVIGTRGIEFEALSQYITENMPNPSNISLASLNDWLQDGGFNDFPKFFFDKMNVSTVEKKKTLDKPISDESIGKFDDNDFKPEEASTESDSSKKIDTINISSEISAILHKSDSVSIISKDDPNKLSNELMISYISELRDSSSRLSKITESEIKEGVDSCIIALNDFFADIVKKDILIRKSLFDFRIKNPLNIESVTTSWEFKNNFSITNKVMADPLIVSEISSFISRVVYYKSLFRSNYTLDKIIKDRSKKYQMSIGLESGDQELVKDAISKISSLIAVELVSVSKKELIKCLASLFDGGNMLSISFDNIFSNMIKKINISYMINKYITQFFSSKEKVLEKNEVQIIKCGICEQSFAIPKEYKDSLESYSKEVEQYSFFRKDGSLITEEELGGADGKSLIHNISDETFNLLVDRESRMASSKTIRRTVGGGDVKRVASRKSYSWFEINKMIFNSERVEDQIDGLIIRNDVLKLAGATPTGNRGIFSNKTLCASSLYGVSASVKTADKFYTSNEDNFECKGSTMASFEPLKFAKEYQSSSYTMPYGNLLKSDSATKNTGLGFRFSRNISFCPCHIESDSYLIDAVIKNKSYYGAFNIIAIPNVPQSIVDGLLKTDGFNSIDKSSIYSPPTLPSGVESTTSSAGYVVCGRRVPLSMFDRDPNSENYIQNFFRKILAADGMSGLARAVKILLNYGVEMNDIKPHVESVAFVSDADKISLSRKNIINSIFKKSKITTAQELPGSESIYIKDIGLVCEHGHKFTLAQSWSFAKTHHAIDLFGRGTISVPIKTMKSKSSFFGSNDDIFAAISDIGIFRASSEEDLTNGGYVDSSTIKDVKELKRLIAEKLLYFRNSDGTLYVLGSPQYGRFKQTPWVYDDVGKQSQYTQEFYVHQSGSSSLQTKDEEGNTVEVSIADQNSISVDELNSQIDDGAINQQRIDLSFANAIYPSLADSMSNLMQENVYSFSQSYQTKMNVLSRDFSSKLLKTIRLARVWGSMSADSQLDFMSGISTTISMNKQELDVLKQNILGELSKISIPIGIKPEDYSDEFFVKYDIDHLVLDNISGQRFLSLATIAQYYAGFSVPFMANMPAKDGKRAVITSIFDALKKNIPKIISESVGLNVSDKINENTLNVACDGIANLLFYPYSKIFSSASSYKTLMENAVVDYTGRAIVFSFAIGFIDRLKIFFSQYFFNEDSTMYIGPNKNELHKLTDILHEFFGTETFENKDVPLILVIDNASFDEKIIQLKKILDYSYSPRELFTSCMTNNNVKIAESELQLNAQMAVVYARFCKLFEMASNSIDVINLSLSNQTINSANIGKSAELLDSTIVYLAMNRDPENYQNLIDSISANKASFGPGVFEKNSAAYARVRLDASNNSLASITYLESNIVSFQLKKEAMSASYFDIRTIGGDEIDTPNLFGLKKIKIDAGSQDGKIFYLALIPEIQKNIESKISKKIDIKEYLAFNTETIISLNSNQGSEFSERYLPGITLDITRLVLVSQELVLGRTTSVGLKDPVIDNIIAKNRDMTMRIGKIDDPPSFWPPPNNLLLNNFDIFRKDTDQKFYPTDNSQSAASVGVINNYYDTNISMDNHEEFVKNITNFPTSITSRSMDPSSSHGLLIPFRQGQNTRMADISQVSNMVAHDKTEHSKNFFSLSRAAIYVSTDSDIEDIVLRSGPLDLSWAFKALDPQFPDESGNIRHNLVQSGSVQKLEFISSQMKLIYEWIKKNTPSAVETLTGSHCNNYYDFVSTLFSTATGCMNFSVDFTDSAMRASLNTQDSGLEKLKNLNQAEYGELLSKLLKLVSYYNCAQILNSQYKSLVPALTVVRSYDVSNEQETKSLALKLLDPYSLWKIVTNPAMSSQFGGPIQKTQIEHYKSFIISTFGIADIRTKICIETGISANKFSNEDMFDIPKFCDEYISDVTSGMDDAIVRFMRLMNITYNEELGAVNRYSNGMPISIGKSSKLSNIIKSADFSETEIHPSSFVDHIYRVENSMSGLSEAEKKIPAIVQSRRERDVALQNGEDSHTIKELLAFGAGRVNADYRSLAKESRHIMAKLYSGNSKKASNVISIRKIAQSATDDDGTIIIALYHEWWGRYLDTMANLAK